MNFIIQITDGFDGAVLKETARTTYEKALVWLRASVPDPQVMKEPGHWGGTIIRRGPERTIIDYGSHKYFGRLYRNDEGGAA